MLRKILSINEDSMKMLNRKDEVLEERIVFFYIVDSSFSSHGYALGGYFSLVD